MNETDHRSENPTILVKLFATLREGRGKTIDFPYTDNLTTGDIITALNIPPAEVSILLVNGRDADYSRVLLPTDYLSIFPPVGGG
ncbi:MAG: MoaD/ThiS family protein [Clostridiaceae bacterium]